MKSKKWLVKVAFAIFMVLAFSFQASAAGTKWRLQHSWGAAENHFFEHYAKIVNEMSAGKIQISVFADGELVNVEKLCDAVSAGTLEMGHTHPDYQMGSVPVGELESAPYLFGNLKEEMAAIYRYGLGDIYKEAFEKRYKIKVLGFQADDCGALMFTKEVNSLQDMKGMNINILDPYATFLHDLTGASSVYMGPEELYTALSRNVIQGVEYGGAKAMYDMSLHEVTKSFLLPRHQVAYFPFYFINKRAWDKLPTDHQAILVNAVQANTVYMAAFYAEKEQEALKTMADKHGIKVTHLPEEDVKAITNKSVEWIKNDFSKRGPFCKKAADAVLKAMKDFGRIE
ncbi:MAG: TRAP transporter substrate-binding protein DctP [Deltaproteobacteria bacterium]|nr:TRAP transporter substrate-binding protein DctP [Deltaproteobacteria bacterium]